MSQFHAMFASQQQFFNQGHTAAVVFRLQQLRKLKTIINDHEAEILAALKLDLGKAPLESWMSEVNFLIKEIDTTIKYLKKWLRPKKVRTGLRLMPGRSQVVYEPRGCVLIIAPWNYPFLLVFLPLVGAIAAGNCAIIKPSEISMHTQQVCLQLINNHFPSHYLYALDADAKKTEELLHLPFDYIFFTGSTAVGKKILAATAFQLTPVTLELGGKSPCIVDETADLNFAARRIVCGKFLNTGQTCIAPDFLYVHVNCKEKLLTKIKNVLREFYGCDPKQSASYGRIINLAHCQRLVSLLKSGNTVIGGEYDTEQRYIAPTILDAVTWDDIVMQEEIFG